MNALYEKFLGYQKRQTAYNAAFALMGWDQETLAPEGANRLSSEIMGILSGEYFTLSTDPEYLDVVEKLAADDTLDPEQKEIIRKTKKSLDDMKVIPKAEFEIFNVLIAKSTMAWQQARANADFESFCPVLEEIFAMSKKMTGYQKKADMSLYDTILDQNEEGFITSELDKFFDLLKTEIVPLLKAAEEKNDTIRTDFLRRSYDIEKQKEFNRFLSAYVGFDLARGVIGESAHPFTTGLHKDDVRFTTAYFENMPESAIFSTIHESGHGMFEQDQPGDTELVQAASLSMGIHESQSRLYENMIGRNHAFWEPIYGNLQALFPENLNDVTLDEFVKAINKPSASLIRTEADELTYCLHIMIRYEIEKQVFAGKVETKDLPALWNKLYKDYLGVDVPDDAQGLLQDIHWSQGLIGYFPSYAIGNAIAAQLYHTMDQAIGVETCLREGRLDAIHQWLDENVHKKAGVTPVMELLKQVTGETFEPKYYVDYLKDKFTKLYD